MAKQFHSLTVLDIRKETADCVSISFEIPDELKETFSYEAGQNITLRMMMDGREIRRSYSICSSPREKEFRIAVKKVEEGLFSSHAHKYFKSGDILEVMPPSGIFHLHADSANVKHYVAIAAGSGITPIISMLKTILKDEPLSRLTLIYGNKNRSTIIFREELLAIKNQYPQTFQLIQLFSQEKMDAPVFEGRIDPAKCEMLFNQVVPIEPGQEYLLCGPPSMIFSVRDWLLQKKVAPEKIQFELFSGVADTFSPLKKLKPVQSIGSVMETFVTVRLDGISTDFIMPLQGPTILDAAVAAGADLPWACRAGVCATCRAKLIEGTVTMDQNYALADEEIREGFILTCQSHPSSEKLVVDFDIR